MSPLQNIQDFRDNHVLVDVNQIGPKFFEVKCTAGSDIGDIFLQIDDKDHIVVLNEDRVEQLRISNSNLRLGDVLSGWVGGMCSFKSADVDESKKLPGFRGSSNGRRQIEQ